MDAPGQRQSYMTIKIQHSSYAWILLWLSSVRAFEELRIQMKDSWKYNVTAVPCEEEKLTFTVTARQTCFTSVVDESKGHTVVVDKATGMHTCCCGFAVDMGLVCNQ